MNKNKHLSLQDRIEIQRGLSDRLSFKKIGLTIGKDCTTISKEVKSHLIFEKKGAPFRQFNDCLYRKKCPNVASLCITCSKPKHSSCVSCIKCISACPDYKKESCPRLLKPPYVCNGCKELSRCTLEKHMYDAKKADAEYRLILSESRSGFNITEDELRQLNSVISPLIKQGQSLHHIMKNNADSITICERTAYIYTGNSLFDARNLDMPRKVRFRPRKKKSVPLKTDKSCRIGRTYEDFLKFHEDNPSLPVVELDSVEGIKGHSVILTVHFVLQKLQLAFKREANTSRSVTDIFNHFYEILGPDNYMKLFPVLLADNGTEFSDPKAIEFDNDGKQRSHVFYCHPQAPNEKGSCEVNHEFIRRIIPKHTDLDPYSQEQIDLMMNNINSYTRPELGDHTPYEMFRFQYGDEIPKLLGIKPVAPNDVILKPSLLSRKDESKKD